MKPDKYKDVAPAQTPAPDPALAVKLTLGEWMLAIADTINFDHEHVWERLVAASLVSVHQKLDLILTLLRADAVLERQQMATVTDVNTKVDQLKVSVEAETNLSASIVTFMKGQSEMIKDLKQQLADAIRAGGDQSAALQAVVDALGVIQETNDTNAKSIADAMIANTPAAKAA